MKKGLLLLIIAITAAAIFAVVARMHRPEPAISNASGFAGGSSRLAQLLGPEDVDGYAVAIEPHEFRFPADHGPHPLFRNEWWYFTGNLDGEGGERFGFEFTIFRFLLSPPVDALRPSGWQTGQVYVGHFAITDVGGEQFHVAQRYSRDSVGLAGAQAEPFRVWVEDWSATASPGSGPSWQLRAADSAMSIDLTLTPLKQPVLNGKDGLSQKSAQPGNASYYYSISRLLTEGKLRIGAQQHDVAGLSWLDREWSSSALSHEQAGWDWFALQLDDGSELMFYQLRHMDGSSDPYSAGTWIGRAGESRFLSGAEVEIEVTGGWDSPIGGRYPMAWRIGIPRLDLQLDVQPVMEAQELQTVVRYWEGAVDVSGVRNGASLAGRGYVELTGYAEIGEPGIQ